MPCERVFFGAETATKKRNRLHPSFFEALQILKFGYKKELLDFTKGWVTVESDMIPQNKTRNGLSSPLKDDNDQLVINNILKEMIVRDKLELEMGSE